MSVVDELRDAWMKEFPSSTPLPDLPHLGVIHDCACAEQVLGGVRRTIADCEAVIGDLQCELDQRRFIVEFLRGFIERQSSSSSFPLLYDQSPGPPPIAPVRLRHRARMTQPPAGETVPKTRGHILETS